MEKKRPVYGYDVYYRLKTSSCVLVAAHNKEEAKKEFERIFENMTKEEIVDRFLAALDYDPDVEITSMDRVDKLEEEDLEGWEGGRE